MKKFVILGIVFGFAMMDCHSQAISFDSSFGVFGAKSYNNSEFPYRFPGMRLGSENQIVLMTGILFAIYDRQGDLINLNPNSNPDSLYSGMWKSIHGFEIDLYNQAKILFSDNLRGVDLCYLKTLDLNRVKDPDFNKKKVLFLDSIRQLHNFVLGSIDTTVMLALSRLSKKESNELEFYKIPSVQSILRKKIKIPDDFSCVDSNFVSNYLSNIVFDPVQNACLMVRQVCDANQGRDLLFKVNYNLELVRDFGNDGFMILSQDLSRYQFIHLFYHEGLILQYWDRESNDMVFIKYDPDGKVDLDFGSNGMIRYKLSGIKNEITSKAILIEEDEVFLFFDRDNASDSSYLEAVNFKGEKVNNLVKEGKIAISGIVAQFESKDKRNFYLLGRPSIFLSDENKMYKLVKNGKLTSQTFDSKHTTFELEKSGNEIVIHGDLPGEWKIEANDLIGRKLNAKVSYSESQIKINLEDNIFPGSVYFIRMIHGSKRGQTFKVCH